MKHLLEYTWRYMKLKKVILYKKVHKVHNTILYTSNVEKVDFMLHCFYHIKQYGDRGGKKDCSLSGSSVRGIFQAWVLEWIAISFSRGSSRPRNRSQISCIVGRRFTVWATREAQQSQSIILICSQYRKLLRYFASLWSLWSRCLYYTYYISFYMSF